MKTMHSNFFEGEKCVGVMF